MNVYRPSRFTRIAQIIVFGIGIVLSISAIGVGIYLFQIQPFFTVIALVASLWMLWFIVRRSYEIAYQHHITLSDKGISWRYLGVTGFAVWDIVEVFDIDDERGWTNMTFATSDNRHVSIRVGGYRTNVKLPSYDVWGIRLGEDAQLETTLLSDVPYGSHNLIPITLITKIPLYRDKSIDYERFIETEFGQELYHYAPHLFEDVQKSEHHENHAMMDISSQQKKMRL